MHICIKYHSRCGGSQHLRFMWSIIHIFFRTKITTPWSLSLLLLHELFLLPFVLGLELEISEEEEELLYVFQGSLQEAIARVRETCNRTRREKWKAGPAFRCALRGFLFSVTFWERISKSHWGSFIDWIRKPARRSGTNEELSHFVLLQTTWSQRPESSLLPQEVTSGYGSLIKALDLPTPII